uniref:Uncharacterized protein n=1 Tax=Cacopsylla melanoneura TaxID=428564 RepID=A0A8D9BH00_9HEMI
MMVCWAENHSRDPISDTGNVRRRRTSSITFSEPLLSSWRSCLLEISCFLLGTTCPVGIGLLLFAYYQCTRLGTTCQVEIRIIFFSLIPLLVSVCRYSFGNH